MASSWFKHFMADKAGIDLDQPRSRRERSHAAEPPMDLANMRHNGVHALAVSCLDCFHRAEVNVDQHPGHLAVKSFEARMVCGRCQSHRVDVRPAWGTKPLHIPPP